jgi:NADPH:quinone reductase-like Zn-dependent oxidoreductase
VRDYSHYDYRSQNFEDLVHDYDAVFDTAGGKTYKRSFKVLNKGGIIFSMVEQPNLDLMDEYGVCGIRQDVNRRDRLLL